MFLSRTGPESMRFLYSGYVKDISLEQVAAVHVFGVRYPWLNSQQLPMATYFMHTCQLVGSKKPSEKLCLIKNMYIHVKCDYILGFIRVGSAFFALMF